LKNLWLRGEYPDSYLPAILLWSVLAAVSLAYLVVRFLKKSHILQVQPVTSP